MKIREALTYDDVLLVPKYSTIESRSQVDLSVHLPKKFSFKHPFIPANMLNITGEKMAQCIADSGGLAILHRFMPIEEQLEILNRLYMISKERTPDYMRQIGFSIGVKNNEDAEQLIGLGAQIICIDIAHGDSLGCINACRFIANKYPEVLLIAGNVASSSGARRLWDAGADVIKAGVGSGSLCSTRIETGNGVPQLDIISDIYEYTSKNRMMIADGGLSSAGNCVKALCFADMVMAGNLFAGTEETPGEIKYINGLPYKEYNGSSTLKDNHVEGVRSIVPLKGKVEEVLKKLSEGVKSGLSYQGCINLSELKKYPEFVKITAPGLKETHPHDVIITS